MSQSYSQSKQRQARKNVRSTTTTTTVAPTTSRRLSLSSYATKSAATTIFELPTTVAKQETTILTTFPTSSTTIKQKYHARFNAGAEQEITPSSNGFSKTPSTKPPRSYYSDRNKKVNGRLDVPEKPVQKTNKYFAESQQVLY